GLLPHRHPFGSRPAPPKWPPRTRRAGGECRLRGDGRWAPRRGELRLRRARRRRPRLRHLPAPAPPRASAHPLRGGRRSGGPCVHADPPSDPARDPGDHRGSARTGGLGRADPRGLSRRLRGRTLRRAAAFARRGLAQASRGNQQGLHRLRRERLALSGLCRHRQPDQGRGGAGRAEPQPPLRLGREARPRRSAMVPSLIPPLGFSFSGVHAGIKSYRPDLALVFSEAPCAAAGCFTRNLARAAAVQDAAVRLPASGIRAVLVYPGNATALTGAAGHEAVRRIVAATAQTLRVPAPAVLTASTGVTGVPLPTAKIEAALPALARGLGPDPLPAARAILTTDTRVKTSSAELRIGGKTVRLLAIAKGAGMIAPSLATTIAVICTDAAIAPPLLQKALSRAMESTFHA